jgi:predicted nucleic acid-binding protein
MDVLVSDTSVLIDLERAELSDLLFAIGHRVVVPDLLYAQELEPWDGASWLQRGLEVTGLDEDETALAQQHALEWRAISLTDAFGLAVAQSRGWILLAGDRALRDRAAACNVRCHGFLWVAEQMVETGCNPGQIAAGVTRLLEHPRCRLPRQETELFVRRLRPP